MTSPVWLTGFEHGVATPTTNGGGLFNTVTGSPSIQSTTKNTGSYALRLNPSSAIYTVFKNLSSPTVVVGRLYFRFASWAGVDNEIVYVTVAAGVNLAIKINATTKKLYARFWSTSSSSDHATTLALNTWYRLDFRFDVSTGTSKIDFQVDGVAATQYTLSQSATTCSSIAIGPSNSDTMDLFIDDVVVSVTTGDYPIGAGGTEALSPASDGTHNAGTNVMENNAGTDIGVTTAYDKLNSIPPSSTTYVQQAAVGTGNYAEVLFGDIAATHSAIIGAMGILAYTSATTSTNQGATIMSKDSFSSQTDIWGNPTTRADMSDGSTSNLYYKSALIAGVVDDTTVNALKARVGYSNDVSPNPYWIDLIVEVAYSVATGLSATVNQVTETDTAQPIARVKLKSVAQVIETDTAQAITERKVKAVAQVTETDTAQAFTTRKVKEIAQVTETDSVQVLTARKEKAIAQISETDTAQTLSASKARVISQVEETDTAQTILSIKQKSIGQAEETDSAQPFAEVGAIVGVIGQVSETDLAQQLFPLKRVSIAQVVESDSAQSITRVKAKAIEQVTEIDFAQSVLQEGVITAIIGQVVEVDSVFHIARSYTGYIGDLTLYPRSVDLSLDERTTELTLRRRSQSLSLQELE